MPSILTVDDSITTRRMVSFALKGAGFEVIQAIDGNDALVKVKTGTPDIILSDTDMPGMDGFELVKNLRAQPAYRNTPIILISNEPNDRERQQGRAAGANAILRKPVSEKHLVESIEKIIAA